MERLLLFLTLTVSLAIVFTFTLEVLDTKPYDAGVLVRELKTACYLSSYNRTITLYLQYPVYIYNGCIVFEVPVPPYGSSITLPVRVYKNMTLQGLVTLSIVKERGFIWLKRC